MRKRAVGGKGKGDVAGRGLKPPVSKPPNLAVTPDDGDGTAVRTRFGTTIRFGELIQSRPEMILKARSVGGRKRGPGHEPSRDDQGKDERRASHGAGQKCTGCGHSAGGSRTLLDTDVRTWALEYYRLRGSAGVNSA